MSKAKDYGSVPKIKIDIKNKSKVDLDPALVQFVDYDILEGDYDDQGSPDDSTSDSDGSTSTGTGGTDDGGTGGTGTGGTSGDDPPGDTTQTIPIPTLIPGSISQTPRVLADGTTVIDITFEVTDVIGVLKYEIRSSIPS